MKVVFIIYVLYLSIGGVLAGLRAFQYWRSEADNANKLAVLIFGSAMLDFLSVGIMLRLWFSDVVSEWTILFTGVIIVGVYTVIRRLFESKLATGKFLRL